MGEGDFTFTFAFAAWRAIHYYPMASRIADTSRIDRASSMEDLFLEEGIPHKYLTSRDVWDGICSTRYEPIGRRGEDRVGVPCKPAPSMHEVKAKCIASCADAALKFPTHRHNGRLKLKVLQFLPVPCAHPVCEFGNPTSMPRHQKHVWSLCVSLTSSRQR